MLRTVEIECEVGFALAVLVLDDDSVGGAIRRGRIAQLERDEPDARSFFPQHVRVPVCAKRKVRWLNDN